MFGIFSKTKEYDLKGPQFKEKYIQSKGAVLVDVRTAGEFRGGTIKGARNLDVMSSNFMNQFENLPKDKEYFLFCRSGSRSGQACKLLIKQGFTVYNLDGGIGDWPE